MKQQLSSDFTFVEKFIYPIAVVSVVAAVVVFKGDAILQQFSDGVDPKGVLIALILLLVFGFLLRNAVLAKAISIDDTHLYVSNYRKEIRVPLSEIAEVKQGFWNRRKYGETVSITFKTPTELGRRVIFFPMPRSWVQGHEDHPVVAELQNRVDLSDPGIAESAQPEKPKPPFDHRLGPDLVRAVDANDLAWAESLLRQGAPASFVLSEWSDRPSIGLRFAPRNAKEGETPAIYVACKLKNVDMAKLLLRHGADPNARFRHFWVDDGCRMDENWESCLGAAFPSVELVGVLLEAGADPAVCWSEGPGLEWGLLASAAGNQELLAVLHRYGYREPSGG